MKSCPFTTLVPSRKKGERESHNMISSGSADSNFILFLEIDSAELSSKCDELFYYFNRNNIDYPDSSNLYYILEEYIRQEHVPGEGNCLVRTSVGLAAINCFYDDIGCICEKRGKA